MKKLFIIIATSVFILSCNLNTVKGDKNIVTKEYAISDFTKIDISTTGNIEYRQDSSKVLGLSIEIDSNLVEYLDVKMENEHLYIKNKNNTSIAPSRFVIYTNSKTIERITLSGVGNFNTTEKILAAKLDINLTGVGDVKFDDLDTDSVKIKLSGAGNISLEGKAVFADFSLSGVGDIKAKQFITKNAECKLSGIGDININATDSLRTSLSGVGKIRYEGSPHVVNNVSGVGGINKSKKE